VLGAATPQTAEINGSNGDSGRLNSVKSLIEVNQLLEKIPNKIKNKIKVKAYPKSLIENFGGYNTIDYICGLEKKYKDYIDTNISAKNLMKTSELVIINYVSTTHLESLHSNIPTLLYWPSHRFKIDKNFAVNLEGLVRAKIIHFSINSLVNHLIQIDSDVLAWWCRPEVQIERLNFLKLNCDDGSSVFEFFATLTDNRD
jgi:putative transferase (TIGR04331 family)